MPTIVKTIKRKPREGDVVLAKGTGRLFLVERIYYKGLTNRIDFYGVVDVVTQNYPNVFYPNEIETVSAADRQHWLKD